MATTSKTTDDLAALENEVSMFEPKKPKKRGFFRSLFKGIRWILLFVLLLILLILLAVWFVAGTDKGFDLALSQASQRVEGLTISNPGGNVNTGISAQTLNYKNDTIAVDIEGLDSAWQTGCLTEKKFCVDRLVIDRMRVESLAEPVPTNDEKRTTAIELPAIKLPLDVNIDDVRIREFIFKPFGEAPEQVIKDIALKANNQGNQLNIQTLSASYNNFSLNADGQIDLENNYPLDLNINATGTDVIEEHDITLALNASDSVENLILNGTVGGAVNATIEGNVQALEPTLPLNLTVKTDAAGWPLDTQKIAKATNLELNVDGDLNDFNIDLNTALSGEQIPNTQIDIQAIANPSRVLVPSLDIQTLKGSITGNAGATLGETISWISDIDFKDINPRSLLPKEQQDFQGELNGTVRADGGVHDGKWMLNLNQGDVSGKLRGIPFMLSTQLTKTYDEQWNVKKLKLDNGNNRVDASGTAGKTLDLDADISLTELQNFLPGLAGGFEADLKVTGNPTSPTVDLAAQSAVLKYQDILITDLAINADIAQFFEEDSALTVEIGLIQKDVTEVLNTQLAVTGTRSEHSVKFFVDGPQATSLDLNVTGALTDSFDWLGEMQTALIEVPAHKISLAEPFTLGWNNEIKKARIGAHCWQTEETQLCLKNEVLAEPTGTAAIDLSAYPLSRLDPFLTANTKLEGQLEVDAVVSWGEEQPGGFNATVVTQVNDGGVTLEDDAFDKLTFSYDTFSLNTRANGEELKAEIMLDSEALGKAEANITLDPTVETQPIIGDLQLTGFDIGFLKAFLPQFDEVGGIINTQGDISGTLKEPNFNGQVVLDELVVQAESLPLNIDDGRITADVDGSRANIAGGLKSGEGKVDISGTADWEKLDAWKANILIEADSLNVQSDPLVESSVNAAIKISARPGDIGVSGNVDIPMALIIVEEIAQGASSLSSDIIIIEDEEENAKAAVAANATPATKIDVDLDISLGDDIKVEAFGLEAQLTGDMTVAVEPPRPPELGGEIRIIEGIFKQYSQDLTVTDGEILFVGPVDQTRLNMDAVREIDNEDRIAGLRISGQISDPEITLFTEPSDREQDSILSYIVLGRDINDTSGAEQNLLASAALALTLRGSRGTATNIAESLGIKDFGLDARGQGDQTEVVVSGRLNDRLLVRYGQSLFTATNTLYVRYELSRKLYLEAASSAFTKAVDLVYSFSF